MEEEVPDTVRKEEAGGSAKTRSPKTAANAERAKLRQRAGS